MKKRLFSFLLIVSIAASVSAQKAQIVQAGTTEANLRKTIEYLASDKLEGRRTGEPGAQAAAAYIASAFAKIKLKPGGRLANGRSSYMQSFPAKGVAPDKPVTGYNIVGILEGHDKQLRNESIVIGAHYDHLGRGGDGSLAPNSHDVHHGADDNASGTAAIIEMARTMAREKTNKRTIIFVAFSGEEEGLFGSKYYVNNPVFPIENTVAMINLDMVGRLHDGKLTIGGIGTASEWKTLVETNNVEERPPDPTKDRRYLGPAIKVPDPLFTLQLNEDGFGPSDHSSFYTKKIPVLFFFTGTHLDYHKPSDTADKINYEGETKVIAYITSIENAIDQNPVRPTYTVAKSTATPGGGRGGIKITLGTIPSYTDSTDGMVIDGVRDDSPASRAGMMGGDKIIQLARQTINNVQDYTNVLGTLSADTEYEIVFIRGGQRMTRKITPAKRQ